MESIKPREYSASVDIALLVNGKRISVGRVGPHRAILRESYHLPDAQYGTIVVSIDGIVQEREVFLYDGIRPTTNVVEFW